MDVASSFISSNIGVYPSPVSFCPFLIIVRAFILLLSSISSPLVLSIIYGLLGDLAPVNLIEEPNLDSIRVSPGNGSSGANTAESIKLLFSSAFGYSDTLESGWGFQWGWFHTDKGVS